MTTYTPADHLDFIERNTRLAQGRHRALSILNRFHKSSEPLIQSRYYDFFQLNGISGVAIEEFFDEQLKGEENELLTFLTQPNDADSGTAE